MNFLRKLKSFIWSKHFLKNFGLIILVNFILILTTIYILDYTTNHGQKIKVPNLYGKNSKQVKAQIEDLGLQYEILDSIYDPKKPEGTIVSQDPRPTDSSQVYVKAGRIIKIQVTKKTNKVEMPSLIDKSERFAQSVLKNRGLKYTTTYKASSEADGAVLEQRFNNQIIKEGVKIPVGSTIQLTVGRNQASAPVQIPNLVGLTISEAKVRLSSMRSLSLFESYTGCANAADSAVARIKSQSPEYIEGILSPANTTIAVQLDKNFSEGQ